ncbi:triose-phosphate isomerase [Candidatus Dependentiae bacterium]|nr:triose-phosphate isomerase [Candidatus Dependentiae bacterium]
MRKPFIAGNWKMYKNLKDAKMLAINLKNKLIGIKDVNIAVCVNAVCLESVSQILKDSNIFVGAQNMYFEKEGAFTGEISADMILSAGGQYVILGHSERRQYFKETDQTINKKIKASLVSSLLPIFCIGETLDEREKNLTFKVIDTQLQEGLKDITSEDMVKITIAYEPVWAIGTGKTATKEQAQEVHKYIRDWLKKKYGIECSEKIVIQYGGSVKPNNIAELMNQPDIDGALVGGASLDCESFASIVKFK